MAKNANGWVVIQVLMEKEIQGGRDVCIMEVSCVDAEFCQVCKCCEGEGWRWFGVGRGGQAATESASGDVRVSEADFQFLCFACEACGDGGFDSLAQ